ncbi:hypothetical protein [Roseivirga sp. UBA1976]|jgi:hypothetical protein|uniref:hypothetical protein n=1 Tax=Roseivirga sp. UBA1976 TaxID=1947386 RepID=UPI0025802A9B|nr:hypothetical protein [Roseivirga sp. UBA1976]MEC7752531.1 hypothetical protein [Bacteroidota bacterium]|tara:strand:+ start:109 stop:471 length:363 start_codon:yes stop_codon:yes gene_type:complete
MDQEQWIDIGLYAAYILMGVAAVAAIVMNLVNSLGNPKSLLKSGIGIVLLGLIFFIGYSMAPAEFGASTAKAMEAAKMDPTSESAVTTYKLVGGAMTTTLVLVTIAVVGLIYSSIARIVR